MYLKSMENFHVGGGGLKPHNSTLDVMDGISQILDPFGLFRQSQKSITHAINSTGNLVDKTISTGEHVGETALQTGSNLVDKGASIVDNTASALDNILKFFTSSVGLIAIGGVILLVLKK